MTLRWRWRWEKVSITCGWSRSSIGRYVDGVDGIFTGDLRVSSEGVMLLVVLIVLLLLKVLKGMQLCRDRVSLNCLLLMNERHESVITRKSRHDSRHAIRRVDGNRKWNGRPRSLTQFLATLSSWHSIGIVLACLMMKLLMTSQWVVIIVDVL